MVGQHRGPLGPAPEDKTPDSFRLPEIVTGSLLKRLAHFFAGNYEIYRIYQSPERSDKPALPDATRIEQVDGERLDKETSPDLRDQAGYAGDGATVYAYIEQEKILGICCYWEGERYRTRNFWPLQEDEAKLVQIIVTPEARGKGVAPALITHSCADLQENGKNRCYARIWHSNKPSIRAFEKAGWKHIATVIHIYPFGRDKGIRLIHKVKRRR